MQSQPAKAIIYDTTNFPVKVAPLKIGPGVIRHIRIPEGTLIPVSSVLYPLGCRIELVYTKVQCKGSGGYGKLREHTNEVQALSPEVVDGRGAEISSTGPQLP